MKTFAASRPIGLIAAVLLCSGLGAGISYSADISIDEVLRKAKEEAAKSPSPSGTAVKTEIPRAIAIGMNDALNIFGDRIRQHGIILWGESNHEGMQAPEQFMAMAAALKARGLNFAIALEVSSEFDDAADAPDPEKTAAAMTKAQHASWRGPGPTIDILTLAKSKHIPVVFADKPYKDQKNTGNPPIKSSGASAAVNKELADRNEKWLSERDEHMADRLKAAADKYGAVLFQVGGSHVVVNDQGNKTVPVMLSEKYGTDNVLRVVVQGNVDGESSGFDPTKYDYKLFLNADGKLRPHEVADPFNF